VVGGLGFVLILGSACNASVDELPNISATVNSAVSATVLANLDSPEQVPQSPESPAVVAIDIPATVRAAVRATSEASLSVPLIEVTPAPTAVPLIEVTPAPTAVPTTRPSDFDDLKNSAALVTYDDLFRNNELHVGKVVYYRGKTIQVLDVGDEQYQLRINVTNDSFFWTDTVFVDYAGARILEDDIVEFVAEVADLLTYTATLGNDITIPRLIALDLRIELEPPAPTATPMPTVSPTPEPTAIPAPGYSRGVPVAIGTPVQITENGSTIEVTLVDVVRGALAWTMIEAAWSYSDPAPEGSEYLLTSVRVHVLKTPGIDDSLRLSGGDMDVVSGTGSVYKSGFVVPPEPVFDGELFEEGTMTGWIGHLIDESDSNPVMRHEFSRDTPIWFNLSE
jgi:hypothetical protein